MSALVTVQDAFFLAVRSLRASPGRSLILVLGTSVALFLPLFTYQAAARLEVALLARAEASPILVGRKGDEFDLTMNALYFRGQVRDPVPFGERRELSAFGLALPLYVAYSVSGTPLVGTSIEYFEARGLEMATGRRPALLGEVVAGAGAARRFALEPGDRVRSDLTNLYNLAGAYPLLLDVVGILEPSGTPDDEAFFADLRTAWILDGRLHGHQEVTRELAVDRDENGAEDGDSSSPDSAPPSASAANPATPPEQENLEATAAIFLFTELTEQNRASFHMHGSEEEAPVGSFLVLPRDRRAHDQLLGDLALDETYQAVRPVEVIGAVLEIVLRLRDGLSAYFGLIAFSTAAFFTLVIVLSLRLRRREIDLMGRLGCGRFHIAALIGAEVLILVVAAVVVATLSAAVGLSFLDSVI